MTMKITIPEDLAAKLTRMAEQRGVKPERLVVDLLAKKLEGLDLLTPEEIDAEAWNRERAQIEAEMKASDRLDDIVEGRA